MSSCATEVEQAVRAAVTEILPDLDPCEIAPERDLRALGADSVDRVEIIALLTHRLGRRDQISRFADIPNIGALIQFLSEEATG